jgi:phosphoribosylaminoimidazolecarboxamide formyltransferase/IMP cyclohydrolase
LSDRIPIRRALVSVYDKSGLDDLARGLAAAGVELVSTGGSAARIESLGLPVTWVEDLTGFLECLDGRVKTLHPKVHAGILADRRLDTHVQQLAELGIEPFDLVVSNLYPFAQTVASGASPDECVEQIDIGGPSMVRAAAKNHPSVAIVTSPAAYDEVLAALAAGGYTLEQRKRLAAEAFAHTAAYDVQVASWMGNVLTDTSDGTGFPAVTGRLVAMMPPNADTGSHSWALRCASAMSVPTAMPHGLACLMTATVGWSPWSYAARTAASAST